MDGLDLLAIGGLMFMAILGYAMLCMAARSERK